MLFKLSNLNSNLALTLGYLNPALNNSAQYLNLTLPCVLYLPLCKPMLKYKQGRDFTS